MRKRKILFAALAVSAVLVAAGCGGTTGDPVLDEAIASMEAKVPGRDRASVRICEALIAPEGRIDSFADAVAFAGSALEELSNSDDPTGMRNALAGAIIGMGDAALLQDQEAYQAAAVDLAVVCTDVVSGEYGK